MSAGQTVQKHKDYFIVAWEDIKPILLLTRKGAGNYMKRHLMFAVRPKATNITNPRKQAV